MWIFEPTAGLPDFDDTLRAAWDKMMNASYDQNINGKATWNPQEPLSETNGPPDAVQELQAWGKTAGDLRFYNPSHLAPPAGATAANVNWNALPTSFDAMFNGVTKEILTYLDSPQAFPPQQPGGAVPASSIITRIQDEYCEWVVTKDGNGNITKLTFTSEPPEYYQFLYAPDDPKVDTAESQALLVSLYRQITGDQTVQLNDLVKDGAYDPYNKWNNAYAVHMQQPNNTLGAEINIAARSAILRVDANGKIKTDADDLINCGQYGDPSRQSDPTIGAAVNTQARQNRFVTLDNPVGLYMTGLSTVGWTTPDGADPQTFWSVTRGKGGDPSTATIVRAEFAVPAGKGYTVSDIKIGADKIQFGGQIAAHIQMRLGVLVGPVATVAAPQGIPCLGVQPPKKKKKKAGTRTMTGTTR